MRYIDEEKLKSVLRLGFSNSRPFPWSAEIGFLREEAFNILCANMPDIALFEHDFGMGRKFGEKPHERFRLWYHKIKPGKLPKPWQEFIAELNSPEYLDFISHAYDVKDFYLRLEWHYTPTGATVHPHLDGYTTYGAHLFYFNPSEYWRPEWGGATQVLEGKRKFELYDHPDFDDFKIVGEASCIGNASLMFKNSAESWHAVDTLKAPENVYRRLFTVFISKPEPGFLVRVYQKLKSLLKRIVSFVNFK